MGSPSELTLDYKPSMISQQFLPHKLAPAMGVGHADHAQKLEDIVARLEEERLKIDAFKRELPLCMQLLSNAMETYKQQLEATCPPPSTGRLSSRPVLEEFIPLKEKDVQVDGEEVLPSNRAAISPEKAKWVVTEQFWKQNPNEEAKKSQGLVTMIEDGESALDVGPKLALDGKQRNGGAFLPFSKGKEGYKGSPVDLVLASSERKMKSENVEVSKTSEVIIAPVGGVVARDQGIKAAASAANQVDGTEAAAAPSTHRKARRCWSPDLHRKFVNALQMLGGSQVATPKQIRELMKVDGLTNDEVKSHLQKYRLHTRRPIPPPAATAATAPPQVVVLGGIWVPPEYAASAGTAIYGAHPGATTHYCPTSTVPQEFYTAAPHHLRHHVTPSPVAVHHRGAITPFRSVCGSSEMDGCRSGERSESMDDGEDGTGEEEDEEEAEEERESGGKRGWNAAEENLQVLAKVKEDGGEESNGTTTVTLKF